jgi:hypothetical protein
MQMRHKNTKVKRRRKERERERHQRSAIKKMISSSHLSFSSSLISSLPRGGRNASSSGSGNNGNNNNNNNNRNTNINRRDDATFFTKTRRRTKKNQQSSLVTQAGRRGKAKEDLSSSQVAEKIKIPIVGVEVPKPKLPAKVEAMVSGNERTIGIVLASLAIVKMRFGGRNNRRGSMGRLEERGMLDENREVDEEKFFKGMMKTVRTVEMPELTEQQIMAARERRRASRAGDANLAKELETVEIPANHPFASNEKLDAAQEAERKKKIIDANSPRRRTRPAPPKQK